MFPTEVRSVGLSTMSQVRASYLLTVCLLTSCLLPLTSYYFLLRLSTTSQAARLGGAMAPLILLLGDWSPRLPFVVWGAVAAAASLAALLLPETRGKASMETLHDLSCLVALPSPVKTLGSGWRSSFRASDGMLACERA